MKGVAPFADLIGVPFAYGGRDKNSLDCYGLVRELLHRQGIDVPDYQSPDQLALIDSIVSAEKIRWRRTDPGPGSVVLIQIPDRALGGFRACHMGYQISFHEFIHTWPSTGGVTIESLSDWKRRIEGHYRYVP